MFSCVYCRRSFHSLLGYCSHSFHHRNNANFKFICPFSNCIQTFKSGNALRVHASRQHANGSTRGSRAFIQNLRTDIRCTDPLCLEQIKSGSDLIKHIKRHISRGEPMNCPYVACGKKYDKIGSFKCHISRFHCKSSLKDLDQNYIQ